MVHEAATVETPPPTGPVFGLFQQALPGVDLDGAQTPIDTSITIRRDDFVRVMDAARNDERLKFDYLRCLSGVDWVTELEVVYHLWSFRHHHGVAIKVRCPNEDAHVPTVSHIWQTANWHERETREMYGIVFDGHPDLRPLLTEEGLGYYPLLKSHPLADIEDWQEDYLQAVDEAKAQMAAATGVAPVLDERALKIQNAQKKAAIIKKTRDEARAQGMSPEDEKATVQAAIKKFDEEEAAAPVAAGSAAPAAPADPRAAKIQLAQAKAAVITKARNEARAQGMSGEDERQFVAEALKKFSEEQAAPAPTAAPTAAAAATQSPAEARAAKIQLAQAKAAIITKARNEARAQGMSAEDERQYVAEALKKFSQEQGG